MPRANRYFSPGHIWHVTHRCHKQEFLLKFARDRRRWLHWLFEAKKRFSLCVLNYMVTSNHIHLLVHDNGQREIAKSMQLIASRTAQEYNLRKHRKGAYWEDRYHATAIDSHEHLIRCLVYIDLNMVRAGVVGHPSGWEQSGYNEIQAPPKRYSIIALKKLAELSGLSEGSLLKEHHKNWIEEALKTDTSERSDKWTECLAVGSQQFAERFIDEMGFRVKHRISKEVDGQFEIREPVPAYNANL